MVLTIACTRGQTHTPLPKSNISLCWSYPTLQSFLAGQDPAPPPARLARQQHHPTAQPPPSPLSRLSRFQNGVPSLRSAGSNCQGSGIMPHGSKHAGPRQPSTRARHRLPTGVMHPGGGRSTAHGMACGCAQAQHTARAVQCPVHKLLSSSCHPQLRRRMVTGVPLRTLSRSWRMCSGSVPGPCRKRLQGAGGCTGGGWVRPGLSTPPEPLGTNLLCRRWVDAAYSLAQGALCLGPAPKGKAAGTAGQGIQRRPDALGSSRGAAPVVPDGLLPAIACHLEKAF